MRTYNNTVYSDRTDATRLFRLSTNDQNLDARNNIAWVTAAGSNLELLDNPVALPTHDVVREYLKHLSSVARAVNGPFDIGAYEL